MLGRYNQECATHIVVVKTSLSGFDVTAAIIIKLPGNCNWALTLPGAYEGKERTSRIIEK